MVNENICKHTFLKLESLFSQHLFSSILNGCCFLFDFFFFFYPHYFIMTCLGKVKVNHTRLLVNESSFLKCMHK